MLRLGPANLPMNPCFHLIDDQFGVVESKSYRSLIDKLYCLTVIKPDIIFAVERISQFLEKRSFGILSPLRKRSYGVAKGSPNGVIRSALEACTSLHLANSIVIYEMHALPM